jgi:hypothetical protein
VIAPLNIARSIEAGPPVLEEPRLAVVSTNGADGAAEGTRESKGGKDSPRRKRDAASAATRAPATEATAEAGADAGVPDETFTAGAPGAPGRRIRIRQLRAS